MSDHTEEAVFEFHISRKARDHYGFSEYLLSIRGEKVSENIRAIRLLSGKVNDRRKSLKSGRQLRASHLHAAGLIDILFHYIIGLYRKEKSPKLFAELERFLEDRFGGTKLSELLMGFAENFPTHDAYSGGIGAEEYISGKTRGIPHSEVVLEEMILLWLSNINPAFSPLIELIDDKNLKETTCYTSAMDALDVFFRTKPIFGPDKQHLIEILMAPALHSPDSLTGQIEYMLKRWEGLLFRMRDQLLKGLDIIHEEEKLREGFTPGESYIPEFSCIADADYERFSEDLDWMPRVIMMAKCTYVWLDQLSKRHGRQIHRLDQVPDEELDMLASRGFTGLWLIGLWERSRASKCIKQICGNPEAVASAYSLYDYVIADDLGGEEAYQNLKDRASARGVRLASDMVPNHMGIDAKWVVEHPDWFIQLDYPPFPSYSFGGEDLCQDPHLSIQIEDGYWSRSDAAVVFRRHDHRTGDTKYIYHGNDGTQMPWNDTAQLNFLKSEVREAVIQTILHVARKFPIIRFDAAMTLAKRHYQRLWYPPPGSGGDISSRAEHSISNEEFQRLFPDEFWREVVDRVRDEVPDTLLLAEAFWMMEGYFVRTLGMHRVYNSAFMNMLKNEENWKYRQAIKNVLEFNPQIMKRYVNFMNNPDEETAVAQFGKDGKYFGICIMMSTLPGLPMFGHGQIEGFSEKYGMEYRRAYWDEHPDGYLVARHEREIFPLLRKRHLFSGVEKFLLYDFYTPEGRVDEDVFAYSNGAGGENGLVIYLNRFRSTRGRIRISSGFTDGNRIIQRTMGEGLGLRGDKGLCSIFRDHVTGLEYIRLNRELLEEGLYVELGAFQYHVFLDFRQVADSDERPYGKLAAWLEGRGVHSIDDAFVDMQLEGFLHAFHGAVNAGSIRYLSSGFGPAGIDPDVAKTFREKLSSLLEGVKAFEPGVEWDDRFTGEMQRSFENVLTLPEMERGEWGDYLGTSNDPLPAGDCQWYRTMLVWLFTSAVAQLLSKMPHARRSFSWIFERHLRNIIRLSFSELGVYEGGADEEARLTGILIGGAGTLDFTPGRTLRIQMEALLKRGEVQDFIDVNTHENTLWLSRERLETLLYGFFVLAVVNAAKETGDEYSLSGRIKRCYHDVTYILRCAKEAEYRLEMFMDLL